MSKQFLSSFRRSVRQQTGKTKSKKSRRVWGRQMAYEPLEKRDLLAVVALQNLSVSQDTGEKPQSKIWEHAGQFWTVMPNSSGTWVFRLDGTSWTQTIKLSDNNNTRADVRSVNNMAYVLLQDGDFAQLATLQYDSGPDNRFEPWSLQPQLVDVPMNSSVEMATIELDSTGKLWVCYDVSSTIEVRYSEGLHTAWSAPIVVASGINSDDISVIGALPNGSIGVMWSNQNTKKFGFRTHVDTAAPNVWSADEVPAGQSMSGKFADDHLNLAVHSNGTLYAAIKTSYAGSPKMMLLVRRPNGTWDNAYTVDGSGTRPIVVINEAANRLVVAYTTSDSGGDIVYRTSPLDVINISAREVLISGTVNNVTGLRDSFTDKAVFLASSGSSAKGAMFSFDTIVQNQAPLVNAGADQSVPFGTTVNLDGTVSDDGPSGSLATTWSKVSGPGNVTFGNASSVDTTARFSASGNYILRLTGNDGQRTTSDDIAITVAAEVINDPQIPPQGPPSPPASDNPVQIAFQDGLFPSVAYAGTIDTKIASGSKTKSYGSVNEVNVDGSPDEAALFKWDVSAIPTGSIIVSAAIELNAASSSKGNFELYALQRAWDEISATWNQYAAGKNWGGAGANGSGDHTSAVLGQFAPANKGINRIALNDAGVAAVQAWVSNAANNFGIILQDYAVSDGVGISSSEATTKSLRPKLIINYKPSATQTAIPNTPVNQPPVVNVGSDLTVQLGQSLNLSATASDDGKPQSPGLLTAVWSRVSGPGTVTFGSSSSLNTSAQFSTAGTYVLRLTANDGELQTFDELTVNVIQPVSGTVRRGGRG